MRETERDPDQRSDEEAERIARAAIRRSFEIPYQPQKELVGKTPRARAREARQPKTAPKAP